VPESCHKNATGAQEEDSHNGLLANNWEPLQFQPNTFFSPSGMWYVT